MAPNVSGIPVWSHDWIAGKDGAFPLLRDVGRHGSRALALPVAQGRVGAVKDPESTAPLQFLILLVAGLLQRRQKMAIDYLLAENRVLRERLGPKRLRFTDAERRLLAEKGKPVARKLLEDIATLASPETLLRWYRRLVAAKYDGSANSSKRPRGRRASQVARPKNRASTL